MHLRDAPLFGVGMNRYDQLVGHVAHNSYLHAFTELGLFGGTLFVGACYISWRALSGLAALRRRIVDPEMGRSQPYMAAAFAGYATGMMTLTLNYIVPTYLMLGLAAAYSRLTVVNPPEPSQRFDLRLTGRLIGIGLLFLTGLYIFVRIFFQH